jgi:hypothetical protein
MGEAVYLQPADATVAMDDGFSNEERQALHQALDEGIAAARAGDHVDAAEFIQGLLDSK